MIHVSMKQRITISEPMHDLFLFSSPNPSEAVAISALQHDAAAIESHFHFLRQHVLDSQGGGTTHGLLLI